MNRARILLADDHRIVTEGLRILIEAEFDLVGTVQDGQALLETVPVIQPDLVVCDISMPKVNGIDAVRQLKRTGHQTRFVFLTMHADVTYAIRAFDAGAMGYVVKHCATRELLTAIREVLQGRQYVSPIIAEEFRAANTRGLKADADSGLAALTPRQREVLQLLAEGKTAKEIAAVLKISSRTAEFHKYRIMESLHLKSNAELLQFAFKHGLTSTPE